MVLIRRIISQTDPLDRVTSFAYDGLDRPTRIAGPEGLTVDYEYVDEADKSTVRYKDAQGSITISEFDGHGRLTKTTYPDDRFEQLVYDPGHRVMDSTALDGTTTSYDYDDLGRLSGRSRVLADGVEGHTTETIAYNPLGQLTQAVQDGVATVFDYDGLARPSAVAAGSHGVSYRSNPGGLPAQITYPSSFEISKEWTALGLVEGVHLGPDTSSPELAGLQYLGAMPAGKWVRPQVLGGTGNTVSAFSKWTYDSDGRLIASITEDPNGLPLMEENLYRDPRGLLTGHALGAAAKGWSYAFDEAGRLTSATQSSFDASGNATSISASGPLPASFDFSYDSAQNLTEMTQVSSCGTETITLTPDASGRHRPGSIGAETLEWNAAGNLERKGDLKFTYDVENRLIRVDRQTEPEVFEEVASYTYDALNRRIERRIGERTIHTVWDG